MKVIYATILILIPTDLVDDTRRSQHFMSLAYCYTGGGCCGPRGGGFMCEIAKGAPDTSDQGGWIVQYKSRLSS